MTDPLPRVSVLVPVFNGVATLGTAVNSVLSQTLHELEVIIIDDASEDGSLALAHGLAETESRIYVVVSAQNSGPGAARALGLTQARGDWVAILDADDVWESDRLERLIGHAEENSLDAVADNLGLVDPGTGTVVGRAFPLEDEERRLITPERFLANSIPGGRVNLGWMQPVVRRDFLQENALTWPAIRHAEDLVLTMSLLLSGARFELLGWPGYRYTQRRGTVSGEASKVSRTKRSIDEQLQAVHLVHQMLPENASSTVEKRLKSLPNQIAVTSAILDTRDSSGMARLGAMLRAIRYPRALLTCVVARYGPNSKSVV